MLNKNEKINVIKSCTAKFYSIDESLIEDKTRKAEVVKVRHLIVYMIRYEMGLTFREIGEVLNKEVSTVTRNFQTIQDSIHHDKSLQLEVKELKSKIRE